MCLGQSKLPRQSSMLDARQRRCPRAAVMTGNQNVFGMRFRNAGSDRTDTDLGDELNADARRWISVFQVVD